MYVAKLSATDFRSYSQVDLDFSPGVTALVGPNGQGKTNLIEAIGYLATLGSHRVAHDAPMVREGAERAIVRGVVVTHFHPDHAGLAGRVRDAVGRAGRRDEEAPRRV